ncbi:prolipoprotein diacylglyceryl transferase [Candidatus Levibacter sp. Uisw_134_01]|jgi:phosphatidylglycerol:prolipoprotein diacylglycerol transferase|uniref:prolipoprotein diacylglyceryl transferase n=1 Tax=Candidatus Levibacter sp. Uisw_134_01 TaxID=3230999 RepID=UPI003D3B016C
MLEFPNINPVAIDLGIIQIRWYAISYIAGILFSWGLILNIIKFKNLKIDNKVISELISNSMIGIIIGGRLGYVIFYNPDYYLNNLLEIFKLWNGGMSFHGGFIGVVFAVIYSSKISKTAILILADLIAIAAPIGIFFGRLANFINGELYGRITNHSFGMIFPNAGNSPRHPSQLYEAFFEGFLLFIIMLLFIKFTNILNKKGLITALFLSCYGSFRFMIEFFREPDANIGLLYFNFSMGQLLSLPMIIIGLYFIIFIARKKV